MYDPTRIFPVTENCYLPGARFNTDENGTTQAELLVIEPIRDRRNADVHPRAAARTMVQKLHRIALRDALAKYHGVTARGRSDVSELRDPTDAEAGAITTRLAQEPALADQFRKVAELRGILLWLDNLDKRDGIEPRAPAQGNSFPGVSQSGPSVKRAGFIPIGLR